MGWWGKAVGGTLGLLVGGPLWAMVGAAVGHGVDRGAEQAADLFGPARAAQRARLQGVFLETTFTVLGHLAKSDGRVSENSWAARLVGAPGAPGLSAGPRANNPAGPRSPGPMR